MAFKRWYDNDSKLSNVVRAMERMEPSTQQHFAEKLRDLTEDLVFDHGGEAYLATLEPKVREGLNKAQSKNRWYDRYEDLHQAFNNLYALPPGDRREVASRLETPIEIIRGYERHCKETEQAPDSKVIVEVLRTSLVEGPARAKRLYALYLGNFPSTDAVENPPEEQKGLWTRLLESIQSALNTV